MPPFYLEAGSDVGPWPGRGVTGMLSLYEKVGGAVVYVRGTPGAAQQRWPSHVASNRVEATGEPRTAD